MRNLESIVKLKVFVHPNSKNSRINKDLMGGFIRICKPAPTGWQSQ